MIDQNLHTAQEIWEYAKVANGLRAIPSHELSSGSTRNIRMPVQFSTWRHSIDVDPIVIETINSQVPVARVIFAKEKLHYATTRNGMLIAAPKVGYLAQRHDKDYQFDLLVKDFSFQLAFLSFAVLASDLLKVAGINTIEDGSFQHV